MNHLSTLEILAYRALNRADGERAADWAIGMLEKGYDNEPIKILSSLTGADNHFEASRYLDQAIFSLNIPTITKETLIVALAAQKLRRALQDNEDLSTALQFGTELYYSENYYSPLLDVYLADNAYHELQESVQQYYLDGVNRDNVIGYIADLAQTLCIKYDVPSLP
jgi:hypothetical protein